MGVCSLSNETSVTGPWGELDLWAGTKSNTIFLITYPMSAGSLDKISYSGDAILNCPLPR